MKIRTITVLAAIVSSGTTPAVAQQVGRFQVVAAPPSSSEATGEIILLDTVTGQTWTLDQALGSIIKWLPLQYYGGPTKLVPLPPPPGKS